MQWSLFQSWVLFKGSGHDRVVYHTVGLSVYLLFIDNVLLVVSTLLISCLLSCCLFIQTVGIGTTMLIIKAFLSEAG